MHAIRLLLVTATRWYPRAEIVCDKRYFESNVELTIA